MTASLFSTSAFFTQCGPEVTHWQGLVEEKEQYSRTRRYRGLLSPVVSTLYNTSHSHGDSYRCHLELPFSLLGAACSISGAT
ncbi:hypothetical protein ACRRTK_021823 [Alexandromys fortis]